MKASLLCWKIWTRFRMTNDARYTLIAEQSYQKRAQKFLRLHPDLRPTYDKLLTDLTVDPFAPALRLHALTGILKGRWAVRLTRAYRITLTLRVTEKRIFLLDIGSHDEVYR
jgi:mRNA-degrading endonuclease YafQ of YafQ-DinJ toxin-antitoxin module